MNQTINGANTNADGNGYRHGLTPDELLAELKQLLQRERSVERIICRYLADLADAVERDDDLLGSYGDIYHLAKSELGMGVRRARSRIRVGRALRELPAIEQAYLGGRLSYSKARELTRVARPEDEQQWLAEAQLLGIRALERRVVQARAAAEGRADDGRGREDEPAQTRHLSPEVVELRMALPAEAWALLERAMQGAKRASEDSMSDAEALAAVAREALAQQDAGDGDPRRTVVLYECRQCQRTELDTGAEPMELPKPAAASLGCGAKVVDLETEGREVKRGGIMPGAVRNAVLLRDRCRCRVPGCNLRRYVEVHHLTEQSRGGEHSRRNCVTLCSRHHTLLHEGKLRIEGDADEGELRFYDEESERWQDPMTHSGASPSSLSPAQAKLLAAMSSRGGWHPDALCAATGLSAQQVSVTLVELMLSGRVTESWGGVFAPTPARPRAAVGIAP